MPNTLIISGVEGTGAERYRVFHRQEMLKLYGRECTIIGYSQLYERPATIRDMVELVARSDIFLFHRTPFTDVIADLLDEITAQAKPAVFDVDDLVFEPELSRFHHGVKQLPADEQARYHEGVHRYLEMLERCDYFIGATDFLAELSRRRGRIAYVDRNCLSLRTISEAAAARSSSRKTPDVVVIGYASGTHTHNEDFLEAAGALIEVLEEYPQVRLCIFGPLDLDSRFAPFADRIKTLPLTNWERVPHAMAQWDINIAPLEMDNPFCRSKSELKYIEAGILGLPTVASRIDAYEFAIRDGRNGFLCATQAEWSQALRRLIEDPELRRDMGRAAETHTIAHYTPLRRSEGFVRLLDRIVDHHRSRPFASLPAPYGKGGERSSGMEIAWILPTPFSGSGGHMTILRNVRFLQQFGHRCTLYFDGGGCFHDVDQLICFLNEYFIDTGAKIRLGFDAIANCDAMIATHWSTVSVVHASDCCSKKVYFVQDFEPHFYPMGTDWVQAEQTYRLGLRCITIGRWLTQMLRLRYDADADYIDFAVETSTYYPRAVERSRPPIVCALAQPEKPRRGFVLLAKALERVHQLYPEVKIVLYGSSKISGNLPFPFENAGLLSVDECAELYSRATVGLILSMSNPSLIGFEMMACGCAVVDLDLENNHFDYGKSQILTLSRPDPESLALNIVGLLNDPMHCREMAEEGRRYIHSRSYEQSARRFEQLLLRSKSEILMRERRDLYQPAQNGVMGEIYGGIEVAQTFRCSANLLCCIDVFMATYNRNNDSRVTFSLRRETPTGEEIARVTIPATTLRDNDWKRIEFEPITGSEGKTFALVIRSDDATPGQAVTVYYHDQTLFEDAELWIAGRPQARGALRFRTYCLRRPDLLPVSRPMKDQRPPSFNLNPVPISLPVANATRAIQPSFNSASADAKLADILQTIQRIDLGKNIQIQEMQHIIHQKDEYIHTIKSHLDGITSSRRWRVVDRLHRIVRRGRRPRPTQTS